MQLKMGSSVSFKSFLYANIDQQFNIWGRGKDI